MRFGREKTFGLPACSLTAADRGRIMQGARDYNRVNRKPRQHNGPLTHAILLVLQTLLFTFHHQVTGECFPSYEAIAAHSGVHRSTVANAVSALEEAGILSWLHRIGRGWKRVRDVLTGKLERVSMVVRRSNAYVSLCHRLRARVRLARSNDGTRSRLPTQEAVSRETRPDLILLLSIIANRRITCVLLTWAPA